MQLVRHGNPLLFGDTRVLVVHLEFTSVCNRQCSYCLEFNGDPNKLREEFSNETKMLEAIDKIFKIARDDDFIGFIIAGGEPTLQPSFKTVINKINARKNTAILLTTNFTQLADYYNELDVPLIVSLHLENNCTKTLFNKLKAVRHLIAHLRIMAHPRKEQEVKAMYAKALELSKEIPLDFAVERIFPFGNYKYYTDDYLSWVNSAERHRCEYNKYLKDKLGLLSEFMHGGIWHRLDENGNLTTEGDAYNLFNFYCERNLLVLYKDGKILMNWCYDPNINIFNVDELPADLFSTVRCTRNCTFGFTSACPKFRSIEYAPKYIKKTGKIEVSNKF